MVMLATPYSLFEQVHLLVEAHSGHIVDEEFAADVTVTAQFTVEHFASFQDALRELSHGTLAAEIVETNENTIMPIGTLTEGE
jgi:hypothetical protein